MLSGNRPRAGGRCAPSRIQRGRDRPARIGRLPIGDGRDESVFLPGSRSGTLAAMDEPVRCAWVGNDPLYVAYHDDEWGVASHDDRYIFEMLLLEGAQAGLNWRLILGKREGYRSAYDDFDPVRIAAWDDAKIESLAGDPAIVRNRLKIRAARTNARAALAVVEEHGGLAPFFWRFVDGNPIVNRWRSVGEVPASTPLSDRVSRELGRRGFKFVGAVICYSFLQAIGMVDDHTRDCFRCRPA